MIIEDSYVWDGVKIEDNCRISKSLLCNNVVVKQYVLDFMFLIIVFISLLDLTDLFQ